MLRNGVQRIYTCRSRCIRIQMILENLGLCVRIGRTERGRSGGADLVTRREDPQMPCSRKWRDLIGTTPNARRAGKDRAVIHILRDAGIRHHVQPTNEHLVFELAMPRPKYAVRVFLSDLSKAKALLANVRESAPFALDEPADDASDMGDEDGRSRTADRDFQPKEATAVVWSGEDTALAELLEACLRENRIGVRREDDANKTGTGPNQIHLLVKPDAEAASREIIREVREATPPQ